MPIWVVDWHGAIILLGGLWAVSLPFVYWFAFKRRTWMLALIYSLPLLWFVVGYVAAM